MIRIYFNDKNCDWCIGINEIISNIKEFSCFPNPANNITKISYELNNNEIVTIFITDMAGKRLQIIKEGKQVKGNHLVDINLSELSNGIYFCTLQTTSSQATKKLMILKN